ncbi:MAG: hypothetical protein AAFR44_11465, partial [Pseudomonadota bacterium]
PATPAPGWAARALLVLVVLAGCARDDEATLRATLDRWFYLGATAHFESRARCTGAMVFVTVDAPRPGRLTVHTDVSAASAAYAADGRAALRIPEASPAALTDQLLAAPDDALGTAILNAGALAAPCFEGAEASGLFREALERPGATLAYDAETGGVMVLDSARLRLFFAAGDVF